MTDDERRAHWDSVYSSKAEDAVSWFQESPAVSLEMLQEAGLDSSMAVIDIGGGASRLVDALLGWPLTDITVLDLSAAALATAQARLRGAERVHWIVADVTKWMPERRYDIWHDRAAFHFLTMPAQQRAYVAGLTQAVRPGGTVIIGTFAPDGPEKCSGLPVARHDSASLAAILGPGFTLQSERRHVHATPWGATQNFQFSRFTRQ